MPSRLSLALLLCVAIAAATAAQDTAPPEPQQPTFRTGTQSVRVDLYATKDGKPVLDLRRDEVEVFEDGIRQNVETFERISFSARTAEPIVQPRSIDDSRDMASDPRSRLFVVFVPMRDPRVRTEPLVQARYPLIQQFNSLLGADDLVAVMTPYMRIADLTFQRRLSLGSDAWSVQPYVHPLHPLWDLCFPSDFAGSPNYEMKARHRELLTFDALEVLITHLGGLRDERKHVFVLTDGFRLYTRNAGLGANDSSRSSPPSSPIPIGVAPRLGDALFGTGTKPQQCETDLADLALLDHSNRLDQIAALARRNNVSIYPISQSGLAPATSSSRGGYGRGGGGYGRGGGGDGDGRGGTSFNRTLFETQSALRGLADDTDGIAIVNTNEVMNNLRKLMAATSAYYLLSYNPTNSTPDGRFRKITVKVNRSSTRLRARPGYVAVRPEDLKPVLPPEPIKRNDPVYTAVNAVANRSSGLLHLRSASWTRSESSGQSSALLWIAGELDAQLRNNGAWTRGASAEVTVRPVRGGTPLTQRADLTDVHAPVEFTFADTRLSPGVYSIQMQIVAADGEPVGDFARVTIPLDPAPLGEAILSRRPSGPGQRFTRTADPRFRRNEVLRFELPTDAGTAATARLLDSKGGQLPVPVQVSDQPDVSEAFRWIVVEVPMIALAPSHYAVEVTQGESSRIAAFTVIP